MTRGQNPVSAMRLQPTAQQGNHSMNDIGVSRSPTCLAKTRRAWELLPFPHVLGRQAHSLILLANGRRSLHELSLLFGDDVAPVARQLLDTGLLQLQTPSEAPPAD